MKNKDAYLYERLVERLEESVTRKQDVLDIDKSRWLEQTFCLCVLGNALAEKRQWSLMGMDAIEYALICRYSWTPTQVREMDPRDKWLSLYEDLAELQLDPVAVAVWWDKQQSVVSRDADSNDPWRPYPLGFPIP